MFVYRHFGKWGFGVGLPTFLFLILPLWLVYEVAKAIVLAIAFVLAETFKAICWAWHQWRASHPPQT
jgi:hypothetical protein